MSHRLVRRHEQRRFALGIRRVGLSLGSQKDPQHVAMAVEGGDLARRRAWRIQGIPLGWGDIYILYIIYIYILYIYI